MPRNRKALAEPSPLCKRLVRLIQEHLPDFPDGPWRLRRVNAGYIQRSHGAFSFYLEWAGDPQDQLARQYDHYVGSQFPATFLVKVGIADLTPRSGDLHINPKGT